jgi:uncharacterized protein (DUF362 family)
MEREPIARAARHQRGNTGARFVGARVSAGPPLFALLALFACPLFACYLLGCHGSPAPAGSDAGAAVPTADRSALTEPSLAPPPGSSRPAADVTTHASPATTGEADAPVAPVAQDGDVDGAALRARNRARIAADKAPVVVLQSHDAHPARDLGQRLCEAVVPKKPAATPILLKPNIGGFDWFKDPAKHDGDDGVRGRVTDPEFVRGVIRCLKARGHDHVTIAEGWGATHKDWVHLVDVTGYAQMAREEHVPLVALDDDGVFDVEGDQPGKPVAIRGMEKTHVPTLLVPKLLADTLAHGMFISLPKIKAHRFAVFSLSIKGMQGTVMLSDKSPAFHNKWRMHRELNPWLDAQKKGHEDRAAYVAALETFAERIADVLEVEAPDVVLAEGAPAEGGDGFEKLWPSGERFAVGGTNPILVDRVGAQLLGLWDNKDLARELGGHATSPLLETAARRFGVDIASPAVTGDGAALLASPRPVHFLGMASFAIHSDGAPSTVSAPTRAPVAPVAPAGDRPVVHAAALGGDVVEIDGRGDEAAWKRATPVEWDTDFAGNASAIRTHVRFLHSPAGLYALWELEGAGLNTDRTRSTDVPRPKLYEEDCVELFFTPDPQHPRHYFETELGPFGHFFDVEVDLDAHTSNTAWTSGVVVRATEDPGARRATIEAELRAPPFLPPAVVPGARLPIGLYRMEGTAPRHYLAFSPPRTEKPNFHVPEAFGTLVVDP